MYFKKTICPICQSKYDCVEKECPNCHSENPKYNKHISRGVSWVHPLFQLGYFLAGYVGLKFVSGILYAIMAIIDLNFLSTLSGTMMLNSITYLILFAGMFVLSYFNWKKIIEKLKDWKPYVVGVIMGGVVIGASVLWSLFVDAIHPVDVNSNEQTIRSVTVEFPALSIFIFGIVGPIVEELTYRLGFFSLMSRVNRVFAYVISALLFGSLHFDLSSIGTETFITELLNIPSYIISGALLALTYDYHGIGASSIAHITNNLVSLIWTLISQ